MPVAGADSADAWLQCLTVPGTFFICYPNTGKHDPGIYGRSKGRNLKMPPALLIATSVATFQVRPETVQGLKSESTLPQKGQKGVSGHSAVRVEVSVFQVPCPGSSGHFHSARRAK